MKKRWILLILPLMMMVMPVATANGWGLPEALVPLVSNTNDYDDYYHLADDYARKENSARIIMQSRYHNQLIAAEKGADGWESVIYSTTAVYQPSEQSTSGKPKLARINNGFELAYPKVKELYRFERINNDRGETAYTLTYAKMGGVEVERQESYRYLVTQGEDSAMWVTEVTLENFNIHNMPRRGVGDVRRMRDVYSSMRCTRITTLWAGLARRMFRGRKAASSRTRSMPRRVRRRPARRRGKRRSAREMSIACIAPKETGR